MWYNNTAMIRYDDSYKIVQGSSFAVAEKKFCNLSEPMPHTFLHYHSDMELLFIDEGETIIWVAGREFKAGKGSLILVNPYEVHSGETVGPRYAHRCICFDIKQLRLPETEKLLSGQVAYANLVDSACDTYGFFTACFEAIKNRFDGWEMRAKGNLLMLFSMLTDRVSAASPTREQTFSKQLLEYLEKHFTEDLTSKEVAEYFSYDHSYFCRKFKKIFMQSFSDYLNGFRVSKAKEMLQNSSVSEVAVSSGFQSISYFSRVFKNVTGQTPSEYRKCAL